jgi:Cu2+-exporting ATPase
MGMFHLIPAFLVVSAAGLVRGRRLNHSLEQTTLATILRTEDKALIPYPESKPVPTDVQSEQVIEHQIQVAKASVGLALVGNLIYPPALLISLPLIFYNSSEVIRAAWKGLRQGRISTEVLYSIDGLGCIASGYYFLNGVANLGYFYSKKVLIKTREKSRASLSNIFNQQPHTIWVWLNDCEVEIPFQELDVSMLVVVQAGDNIPVDGVIEQGMANVDQRVLTGESRPVEKSVGDTVFAATTLLSGRILVRVNQIGSTTVAAQIGELLEKTVDFKSTIEARSEQISASLVIPSLIAGGITWTILGLPAAVALLSANFSEVLQICSPIAVMNYLELASRDGILVKDGRSLEMLTRVDTIVFDKTGTLTHNKPNVSKVHAYNGWNEKNVLAYAAAAEYRQPHPIALAIIEAAKARQLVLAKVDEVRYEMGFGIWIKAEGHEIRVGSARFMEIEGIDLPAEARSVQAQCHAEGHSLVFVAIDQYLAGTIELQVAVRPEVPVLLEQLRARGLKLYIISGDHTAPTQRLANQLGITHFFAEVLPAEKASYIERLQSEGRVVCFVGDGINDAIAMKKAMVSISPAGASSVATDTAQIILMDETLTQLNRIFELSDQMNKNLKNGVMNSMGASLICATGVLFFHWSILADIVFFCLSMTAGVTNAMLPKWRERRYLSTEEPLDAGKQLTGR